MQNNTAITAKGLVGGLAIVIALMLLIGASLFCVSQATAASIADNQSTSSDANCMTAMASSSDVWVVTAIHEDSEINGEQTKTIAYTKKGLVKKYNGLTIAYGTKGHVKYTISMGQKSLYTYDAKGRIAAYENASGRFTYNAKGRLSKFTFAGGTMYRKYAYDKKGRLKKIEGDGGQDFAIIKLKYDAHNQVKSFSDSEVDITGTIANVYDADGRLAERTITTSDNEVVVQSFTYKKVQVPKAVLAQVKAQQANVMLDGITYMRPAIQAVTK